jgi:two-component system, NarL family, nitrate/nitrite response regulator NarL
VKTPIRIAIADDHPIVLRGLEGLLQAEPDFKIVAQCNDGEEVLTAVRTHHPDVLLLDVRMPVKDGLQVLRELKDEKSATQVILLVATLNDEELLEASRLGVRGVLLKEMAPRLLVQCIRKVHAGEQWIERRSAARAFDMLLRREAGMREISDLLTSREIQIVRCVTRGLRNKAVADALHISEGTVKTHLHTIYEKLKVESRAQLIVYCREKGLT